MSDSNELERIMQGLRQRAGLTEENTPQIDSKPQAQTRPQDTTLISFPEESIPMLTEVVQVPRYSKANLPESIDEVGFAALADRVEQNVMERLLRRSEQHLEERIKIDLAAVFERATQTLAADLQATLSQSIRDMVSSAVSDELTRLQSEITFGNRQKL
jgi:hypothetical protein